MESIFDLRKTQYKYWYGASKKCYRRCDLTKIKNIEDSYSYLLELHTRCRLVPANPEFVNEKGIPHYNIQLERMKLQYPNYKEFQNLKPL